jgi:hypothetical protein
MPVAVDAGVVRLQGPSRVEDAESLIGWLAADPADRAGWTVDLTRADHLHAAVLQVLLAFQPEVIGPPADPFLARWLYPMLRRGGPA